VQYLNNVLEQDHRAIKRRVRASQHFRSVRGDELNCLSSTQIFASTTSLQHCPLTDTGVANIVRGSGEVPVRGQETEKPRLECRSAGRQRRFHRQHRRDRRRIEGFVAKDTIIRLINNPKNRGKGYSMRNGILQAAGEIVMFTDADLSFADRRSRVAICDNP
jgi:glycosyltransferase involved in cell wall biosynthesis